MAVTTTPRLGITRWSAAADPFRRAQLDADHAALEDLVAIHTLGLFNARPAAGVRGRFYWATDVNGGTLYHDDGTAWSPGIVLGNDPRLSDARTPLAHTHAAGDVTSGVFATARLGTGAASSSTFLRGDGTWAGLPGASLSAMSDVALTAPTTGQVLRYDAAAGKWKNATLDAADVGTGVFGLARLPVAASGTSSATQLVRADDARLSNARTPTGHAASHASGGSDPVTPAAIGAASSTDPRLTDARTPTGAAGGDLGGTYPNPTVPGLAGKADKNNGTHTGTTTIGGADTDVEKLRSTVLEVDGRAVTLTYNGDGTLATVVEKAGATTVKTTTLTYSGGNLSTVAEAAGGQTATTTLTYDGTGTLTGTTRSVA